MTLVGNKLNLVITTKLFATLPGGDLAFDSLAFIVVGLVVVLVVVLQVFIFILYKSLYILSIATLSTQLHPRDPTSPPSWRVSLFLIMSFSIGGLALLSFRRPFSDSVGLILGKTDIRSFFCLVIFSIVILVLGNPIFCHAPHIAFQLKYLSFHSLSHKSIREFFSRLPHRAIFSSTSHSSRCQPRRRQQLPR